MNALKCKTLADIYSNDTLFPLQFVYFPGLLLDFFVYTFKNYTYNVWFHCSQAFHIVDIFFVCPGFNSIFPFTINSIAHIFIYTNKLTTNMLQTQDSVFLTHFALCGCRQTDKQTDRQTQTTIILHLHAQVNYT